jgi:hypothetical protein
MTIPDEAEHFDIISRPHSGTLYAIYKARIKTDERIISLKTIKGDMSLVFEAQGIDEREGEKRDKQMPEHCQYHFSRCL